MVFVLWIFVHAVKITVEVGQCFRPNICCHCTDLTYRHQNLNFGIFWNFMNGVDALQPCRKCMYLIMLNRNCFGHIFQRWRCFFFLVQNLISSLFCLLTKYGSIAKLMHVLVRNECISFKFHPGKASCPIHMGYFIPEHLVWTDLNLMRE